MEERGEMSDEEEEAQQKQPLSAEMIDLEPKYSVAVHEALDVYTALVRALRLHFVCSLSAEMRVFVFRCCRERCRRSCDST